MPPLHITNDSITQTTNQSINLSTNQTALTNQLISYTLHLADNALILGHRNSEWCGHGPVLELDIAISNIALDLVGQARNFYQYAADIINKLNETHRKVSPKGGDLEGAATEDTLAYHRNAPDFKNCLLVEQPNGDWGVTIMRQFLFSTYQYYLYQQLQYSNDSQIAAIAKKALKEVTYHVRWSSEWVIRLGAGTEESHRRMMNAVNTFMPYVAELFTPADYEIAAVEEGYGADITTLQPAWLQKIAVVFTDATLSECLPFSLQTGEVPGKSGHHTQHLEALLAEMQVLQRAHPGAEW